MAGVTPGTISGSLQVMPLLILCMGGEMIYILEQRLEAQKIAPQKGEKVLHDVIKSMFFPRFLEELFRPQEVFSLHSCRQVFDRLAHSSIMRLNESSMDKLMDLITMGFKYQFLCCSSGEELCDVAWNHLHACKRIAGNDNNELLALIAQGEEMFQGLFNSMSMYAFRELRMQLAAFLQDRRVKVSLFLQDETQNQDGAIVVPLGGSLPFNSLPPGTVTYLQQDLREELLDGMVSGHGVYFVNQQRVARVNPGSANWSELGTNLYAKNASKSGEKGYNSAGARSSGSESQHLGRSSGMVSPRTAKRNAVDQLNNLAAVLGPSKPADDSDTFHFNNLFQGDRMFDTENVVLMRQGDSPKERAKPIVLKQANAEHKTALDSVRRDLDEQGAAGSAGPVPRNAEEEDLLDLLG